jgi:hypothetical protein
MVSQARVVCQVREVEAIGSARLGRLEARARPERLEAREVEARSESTEVEARARHR